jgi:hypothetical protein
VLVALMVAVSCFEEVLPLNAQSGLINISKKLFAHLA